MHIKQEEILRTRIHSLEKLCLRQEKLLKRCIDVLMDEKHVVLLYDIVKELKNDFC